MYVYTLDELKIIAIKAFPASDTSIVSGDSLTCFIKVENMANFPLFYNWYLNGDLDTTSKSYSYLFFNERTYEGVDTIQVVISNGYDSLSHTWIINSRRYINPKILFDESHDERNTLSWERALEVWPEHPEWVYYGILQSKLEGEYNVSRFTGAKITDSVLDSADALVVAAERTNFTNDEVLSIKKYVEDGGGLLFIGDAGVADNNQLLNVFGISFNERQIYYPGERSGFDVTDFKEHPSIGHNPYIIKRIGEVVLIFIHLPQR